MVRRRRVEALARYLRVVPVELVPLVARPDAGRVFTGTRKVRLGDARPTGELRLDALTRYTQDVSNDDTTEAELPDDMSWVVRKTTVDVLVPAVFGERLEISTFCSGLGRRWAERRLQIQGSQGGRYEVASLWVHLDPDSGRPRGLSDSFRHIYGEAAQGRSVSARLTHRDPPEMEQLESAQWPTRLVDFDLFDHMNNAAYWARVEQLDLPATPPRRHEIEYRAGISQADEVAFLSVTTADVIEGWWMADRSVAATARIAQLPPDLYD